MLMFVVLILICSLLYYQVDNIVKPLISHISLQVVESEAHYLGERFDNQATMLEQLASIETFKNGEISVIQKEIDNQMERHKGLWLSMQYRPVSDVGYDNSLGNIKPFISYEQGLLAGDKLTLISKSVVDGRDGEYITYIGTKVMDNKGKVKGLLIINARVKQLMSSFLETNTNQLTEMWFLDSKGKAIINPNRLAQPIPDIENFAELIAVKSAGEVKISTPGNESKSLIYAQIPNTQGLYLAVGIEHSQSSEAMRGLLLLIVGGAVFACLFIFVAANKMTNLMTKPLTRMVEIIQNSDGGNLMVIPPDLKASRDEIGILANTIDEMSCHIRNNVQALNSEIQERQKAEKKLIQLNDELERRVEERTHAAEEASQAKSQFLANMSHEIRTPMNAIMGLTHLVGQSELTDSQRNYVSKIEGASATLLRIINDILDFSKIEAGKLEIENIKFNLDKVLENVSNLYTTSATNKGIDINFDTGEAVPEVLSGDPLRLEQVLSNLTTNAIKFTNQGEVNVSVRVLEETESKVKLLFKVIDTGIGLTQDQIGSLFTAFTQADGSMTRKYGGTGLGLTISKQLVELMKGEIGVESVYGKGSTFQFVVSFDKVLDIIKTSYAEYPDLLGKKVLVVDHNKTSLAILERMLRSFSLEVTALRNSFEAIERLREEEFDLLVMEFNMPDLSGVDLYKRLVVASEITLPKTIFVSATGRESYYHQVNQLGVKNFLVKPINQSLMFDAVMNALKGTAGSQATKIHPEVSPLKHQRTLVNKRILLVEDNDINQLVAKDILEQVGVRVSIASNGQEAIKHVRTNKFDAVLMDVQMPIMDGYKATEILRLTYSSAELPIIAMTANALRGDRERSIESGMNDYISKPIDPKLLFETLEKWLSGNSMETIQTLVEEPPNQTIKVLELEKTLLRLGNKQEFYYDLLTRYTDNYSHWVKELSDLKLNLQEVEAKRLIHSLKGVTGNIGAMKLNQFIVQFEEHYETYSEQDVAEKLEELSIINEELLKTIEKVLSIKYPQETLWNPKFKLDEALKKLLDALERARAKEIKDSMSFLATNAQDRRFSDQIDGIRKLVDRYRYKEAKVGVKALMDLIKESTYE